MNPKPKFEFAVHDWPHGVYPVICLTWLNDEITVHIVDKEKGNKDLVRAYDLTQGNLIQIQ